MSEKQKDETTHEAACPVLSAELERKVPTLVEFAETLLGTELYPYQRKILESIERGELVQFSRLPSRSSLRKANEKYLAALRSKSENQKDETATVADCPPLSAVVRLVFF